jgi:hypothetical protein
MMLGRQVRLPLDAMVGPPPEAEYEKMRATEYAAELEGAMRLAHGLVSVHVDANYAYQKKSYDRSVKPQVLTVGQAVWLRVYPHQIGQSLALANPWSPAWIIVAKICTVEFKIQRTHAGVALVVHGDRLKPYHGRIASDLTRRLQKSLQKLIE